MTNCAIPGCTDPCRARQLMCRWHWKKVLPELKARVVAAFKTMQAGHGCSEAELIKRLKLIREYQDAKSAAVDQVCKIEGLVRVTDDEARS